jgi:hypothetical protein
LAFEAPVPADMRDLLVHLGLDTGLAKT